MQVFRLGVLAAEPGGKGIVHPQDARAFARDLHRGAGEHGRHIQVLLEVAVGAGAAGDAVAPVDKEVAVVRHRRHGDRLFAGDVKAERGLPCSVAAAQGAAGLVDAVAGFKGIARRFGRRAGGHRVAGVAGVFQGAGGDVGGIGAAVLGLVGVGGEIVQHRLEAAALEVDVPADIVVIQPKAGGGVLEDLGAVQELDPQVLAHGQQGHVEVVDLFLGGGGVVGVILGHRRDGVDNDVGVGIAGLDLLDQLGVIADEGLDLHPVVVGAQGDDHPAGLHHCHRLGHGVPLVGPPEGDQRLRKGRLDADALLGAELLQGDQAVVVQPHGVGVPQEQGVAEVGLAGVGRLGQKRGGLGVHLVVGGQVIRLFHLGHAAGRRAAALGGQQHIGDAGRDQDRQGTDGADKHRLLLDRRHGL